ncbi:MAG: dihydropteroate synthase [Planctomycetes bacterium]|nr:dihydropteroate synthase [Planctomycetota bacterium]
MGILNVTPDSFSDGGQFLKPESAVRHGLEMLRDGADLLDVGAESTRPGSDPVEAEEELRRLRPVLQGLRAETSCPISVDTSKARVADEALRLGANLLNDITGFQGDADMARVAAAHRVPAVLMHIRGTPKTMNQDTRYHDLIGEVCAYLERSIEIAEAAGLPRDYLIVDPGIGFAKGHRQNLEILQRLPELRRLDRPILVGPSRKSFIGHTLGLPPRERVFGTAAAVAIAAWLGAHILRVHDARAMRQVLDVADGIRQPEILKA